MKQKLLLAFIVSQTFIGTHAQQFGNRTLVAPDATYVNSFIFNDIDADGDIDIIATSSNGSISSSSNHVFWHKNLGNNTFSAKTMISSSYGNVAEVKLLDIDGDGKKDLVVADRQSGMSWIKNMGSGFFGTKQSLPYTSALTTFQVGDINNDGKDDIIVAELSNDNMRLLRNTGNGVFVSDGMFFNAPDGVNIYSFAFGDLDQDNVNDLIVSTGGTTSQRIIQFEYVNNAFVQTSIYTNPTSPYIYDSYLRDMDNDGKVDVVTASSDCAIYWFKNFGSNVYSGITPVSTTTCSNMELGNVADLDLDGFSDFVFFRYGLLKYRKGLGFAEINTTMTDIAGNSIIGTIKSARLFDIDQDGDLDIFYNTENEFGWFANNASALSVPENEAATFTIYPNPATSEIRIASTNEVDSYKIYDNTGKLVANATFQMPAAGCTIDVSQLSSGFYFLAIQSGSSRDVKKFVKH